MHRRHLLRSLTLAGLGGVAAACGVRAPRPADTDGTTETGAGSAPRNPTGPRTAPAPPPGPPDGGEAGADDGAPPSEGVEEEAPDATDEEAAADTDDAEPTSPEPPVVEVLCREAVGLRAAQPDAARHRIDQLTVHHTAVTLESVSLAPRRLRRHQRYHMDQGWSDIAYHYAVDLAGNVYELRDPVVPGDTFTDYDTAGHLQVVCEGDFDQQQPSDALLTGLEDLVAGLVAAQGLTPAMIGTHRQHVPSTTCPGDHLHRHLDALRAGVADREAVPRIERFCGEPARRRVAEIEAA